ncbi:MAG: peptidase P60 [Burkholderiaceae bacterium]|jgi:cell wall-associated NlpC family hydrolase|nr:peptidase P60 [Burkholderiaceae bacterium]
MTTRAAIVAEARTWLGTPWVHQHRAKGVAVDCAGLVIGVARALGLVPPEWDINGYSRHPDGTLAALCAAHMRRVSQAAMQPGDVLVLALQADPQHLGIVGDYRHGGYSLIHAASNAGRVIETRLMFAANCKFRGAYALPGVG